LASGRFQPWTSEFQELSAAGAIPPRFSFARFFYGKVAPRRRQPAHAEVATIVMPAIQGTTAR